MALLLATQDVDTMRATVFYDGDDAARRVSRFWVLLVLAAIIASAGVVGDSTATVIGAMIVAPLMGPIQGTMLAVVLADRLNLARCLGLVVTGAAAAVAIGFVMGVFRVTAVVAANNSQVAARVSPRLIDLVAALATGVVGSVALVRKDIADTLPGVAIAISLVPPLTVAGLTLEGGEPREALGALLLFITNVAAILATGIIVMAVYRVHRMASPVASAEVRAVNRRNAVLVIVAMMVVVIVPLTLTSVSIARDTAEQSSVHDVATTWARVVGWELVGVDAEAGKTVTRFEGPLPIPDTASLRQALIEDGIAPGGVRVELLPRETIDLEE